MLHCTNRDSPPGVFFPLFSFTVSLSIEGPRWRWSMRAPYGERGHMQTLRAVCVGSSCGVVGNLVRYGRNHANKAPSMQRADRN